MMNAEEIVRMYRGVIFEQTEKHSELEKYFIQCKLEVIFQIFGIKNFSIENAFNNKVKICKKINNESAKKIFIDLLESYSSIDEYQFEVYNTLYDECESRASTKG
jgi:hypothetical protein